MRRLALLYLLSICVSSALGQAPVLETKEPRKVRAAGLFFREETGSIAFLPAVGSERYLDMVRTHWVLPESGFYKLPRKGNYFFKVNHAASEEEVSYLGVVVYLIYPSTFHHRDPVYLTRNMASWRPGPGRSLGKSRKGPNTPEVPLADFFRAHTDGVASADEILKFTWHAAVETGTPHSFDNRLKWLESNPERLREFSAFIRALGIPAAQHKAAVTAHILHFTTSPSPRTPLVFWFNGDHAKGSYMRVFSPAGPQFDKEFYFKFE